MQGPSEKGSLATRTNCVCENVIPVKQGWRTYLLSRATLSVTAE